MSKRVTLTVKTLEQIDTLKEMAKIMRAGETSPVLFVSKEKFRHEKDDAIRMDQQISRLQKMVDTSFRNLGRLYIAYNTWKDHPLRELIEQENLQLKFQAAPENKFYIDLVRTYKNDGVLDLINKVNAAHIEQMKLVTERITEVESRGSGSIFKLAFATLAWEIGCFFTKLRHLGA